MIVLVKPRHGDLQPTADGQMQPLRQWKAAQYESRRQEDLFFPSNVPPDQNVEFCSIIGQIFPLIL